MLGMKQVYAETKKRIHASAHQPQMVAHLWFDSTGHSQIACILRRATSAAEVEALDT